MDCYAKLEAVEKQINEVSNKIGDVQKDIRALFLKRPPYESISEDDKKGLLTELKAEIAILEAQLTKLEADKQYWQNLVLVTATDNKALESKSFSEADADWISSVTGIDTKRRPWDIYDIDENVFPSDLFKDLFIQISRVFHLEKEAGRRIYLNLFLADIIDREEFQGKLRIFPELEMSIVKVFGNKRRRLGGKHDYTVGFGKEMDPMGDKSPPQELHLVAIEAKRNMEEGNIWQCVAEAATLYRSRKDAGKANCSVWGVLTNAKYWVFIEIDEDGILRRSKDFVLNIPEYHEGEVLFIYRLLYDIVKKCFNSCTPPVSPNK